eukprot:UN15255
MLENSGIYRKIAGFQDLGGFLAKTNGFGLRRHRPLEVQIMRAVRPDLGNSYQFIGNDIWFQVHFDPERPQLRMRIVNDKYSYGKKTFPDPFKKNPPSSFSWCEKRIL